MIGATRKAGEAVLFWRRLWFVALAASLIGCGHTSPRETARKAATFVVPGNMRPSIILAGQGVGWVLQDESGDSGAKSPVWRVNRDGTFDRIAEVPGYDSAIGAFVDGRVVFGGVRCAGEGDSCSGMVAELSMLDSEGRLVQTVTIERSDQRLERSDGLALIGVASHIIWIAGKNGVVAVGSDGMIHDHIPPSQRGYCLVGERLFGLVKETPDIAIDGKGNAPGGSLNPSATSSLSYVVTAWSGRGWDEVAGGSFSRGGMPSLAFASCTNTGYELKTATTQLAEWTPAEGWRDATSNPVGPPFSVSGKTSGTRKEYRLTDEGEVLRRDGDRFTAVGVRFPPPDKDAPPAGMAVDDSGSVLFICVARPRPEGSSEKRCLIADRS